MANLDDIEDVDGKDNPYAQKDKKKILLFLIPGLIVIGLIVGLYFLFVPKSNNQENLPYSVVAQTDTTPLTIFYDLPETDIKLQGHETQDTMVKIKINIELSNMEDIKAVENLMPQITDAIISHTVALTKEEIDGSEGLYWLKEELLYRLNLVTSPVKISNLNFKRFEIQKVN